ncbi:MAG: AAA family ATPase [Actinomycetota bacterium]|nr:AAA family ATPase [Actinomycetota bacterium]
MVQLPEGVVTFLLTDVQGSTHAWEESPHLMMKALVQHDEAIESAVAAHHGVTVKPRGEGDSTFNVFASAIDAVASAAEMQRRLASVAWATPHPLLVRAALHTGTAELHQGDYYGTTVNRAARLKAIAHGGQTIMSRATWELVQDQIPPGVTCRDMGEHALKDLTRPEHVYQMLVDGLPNQFPPLASLDAVPNNLPQQLTNFVGRDAELRDTKRLLEENRLLTILAPGGTGKTRLAIQAAADLTAAHPDGVFLISLADLRSGGDIVQAVAESLGLGLSSDEDVRTQLLTYLANKRQLLIFDNFEHLRDEATIVTNILQAAPYVKVLVTSRAKLNLTGETVLTVSGLETTWDKREDALHTSGVRLFLDAARRARPDFSVAAGDLEPLGRILRLTGGVPLGILLAAAWVDMLPVAEIADEIGKSLDFLETENADVPDRHRSVRAVFDHSWRLLSEDEREVFTALSVFRGGFTREAAQEVAGASLRNLANLANKSLVTPIPSLGRYTIHELLRQYAQAELQAHPDRWKGILDAHAAFYGRMMDDVLAMFVRSDQRLMLATMERDIDNARYAWRHCLATGDARAAHRFMGGFYLLYEVRGWYSTGASLFDEALVALGHESPDEATIQALASAAAVHAWFLSLLGQPEAGASAAAAATAELRASEDAFHLWIALQCQAISLSYLGDVENMVRVSDEGIELGIDLDQPFWIAAMKNWRAAAAILASDNRTAMQLLPESMEVLNERQDHYFMTWNLWLQARIATQEGRFDDAISLFTRQVNRAQEVGYLRAEMVALEGLGQANLAAGQLAAAERAFIESLAMAEQMGMVQDMLGMMTEVARVWAGMDRSLDAVEMLATIIAEPISAQQPLAANTPIRDTASGILNELREQLDQRDYQAAYALGTARSFDVATKVLLDHLKTLPPVGV